MAKKTSNLKVVQQQTHTEDELQAKREREEAWKKREAEEETWKLSRVEITNRVRTLRLQLERFRTQLEGMTFDVVTEDIPRSVDYTTGNRSYPLGLVEAFDPCIEGHYQRLDSAIARDLTDDLCDLEWKLAETSFHIGALGGVCLKRRYRPR